MSTIILPIPPHGYDGTAPAGLNYENNVPKLIFAKTVKQGVYWQFRMPADYASALTMKLVYSMASATTGTTEFEVSVWAATDNERADVVSYDAINVASETVPTTAGLTSDLSIVLANADAVAAGDLVRIKLFRDATDATNDTAAGDSELWAVSLEYTAA